ncbi:MAG: hypothetical protein AB1772_01215 [Candidatus Zixiibacteriota bacterium]
MGFFVVVILALTLVYGYIGWRMIVPATFSLPVSLLLWALIVALLILPFVPIFTRMQGSHPFWADPLAWAAYLSFGFMTLLFAFLIAKDVSFLVAGVVQKSAHWIAHLFNGADIVADSVDPERRRMLTNAVNVGLLGVSGALTGYGLFEATRTPRVIEVDVPLANLPPALDRFRIVQITDLHVSHTIKRPWVQAVVDTVNSLNPDLVALTGDLADGSVARLRDDVAPLADLTAPTVDSSSPAIMIIIPESSNGSMRPPGSVSPCS